MGTSTTKEALYNHAEIQSLKDPIYGTVTIHKNNQNPLTLKCEKFYTEEASPIIHPIKDSSLIFLSKQMHNLPKKIFKASLTEFEQADEGPDIAAIVVYDVGSWSLEDVIEERGAGFEEQLGFSLMMILAKIGSELQDKLNFFPRVTNKEIFLTEEGLKVMNPYIHDNYTANIVEVRQFYKGLLDFGKSFEKS